MGAGGSLAGAAAAVDDVSPFVEPHVNSVLRLCGGWLFDAALNPRRAYSAGRATALLALGKAFVTPRRHGGRLPAAGSVAGSARAPAPPSSPKPAAPHVAR